GGAVVVIGDAVGPDGVAVHHGVHVVLVVGVVVHVPVKLIPAIHGEQQPAVEQMPLRPAPAVHAVVHHVGAVGAVVGDHPVAHVNAHVAVGVLVVVGVHHGDGQPVDAGQL